jgi:hypothetical protein
MRRCDTQDLQLGVTNVRFDALDQLRRHLPDAVLLGVLSRFLEYLLFRLTPYDVLTPARRVYFGAFEDLCHRCVSSFALIHYSPLVAVGILYWVLMRRQCFFSTPYTPDAAARPFR